MLKNLILEAGQRTKTPFLNPKRVRNLDYELLKHMGLTKEKLLKHDAFFFWQLLFPICDPFVTQQSLALWMTQGLRSTRK
jgi:hypothetical protein